MTVKRFPVSLTNSRLRTQTATKITTTTTTRRPACPKCGTIGKSGKASCCGRGGSWFRNCGSAGNAKLRHTWSEGILACTTRAQWNRVRPRQPNGAQQLNSSYHIGMRISKAVITVAKIFEFTSANTSTRIPTAKAATSTPGNTSIQYNTGTALSRTIQSPRQLLHQTTIQLSPQTTRRPAVHPPNS